jgi:superfamily II DNA/RNA helicase
MAVYGGTNVKEQAKGVDRTHVLIATPGRLDDLATRGIVDLDGVQILVLDEADRMLDMGFQPQVDRIVRRLPKDRQTMFFSATLDGAVGRIAQVYTRDPVQHDPQAALGEHREPRPGEIPQPREGHADHASSPGPRTMHS